MTNDRDEAKKNIETIEFVLTNKKYIVFFGGQQIFIQLTLGFSSYSAFHALTNLRTSAPIFCLVRAGLRKKKCRAVGMSKTIFEVGL
jgi:hypothetical protein